MLAYFPRSHPDELLYSLLARCRVHLGLTSHKCFLDLMYQDRTVAAVVDLPSHLKRLARNVSVVRHVDPADFIYQNTLFPLFSPFMPEHRKRLVVNAMKGSEGGTLHTRAGVAAGRVKPLQWLRVCPSCVGEMCRQLGEPYWRRLWQVPGVEICPAHGVALVDTSVHLRQFNRHEFIAVRPELYTTIASERPIGLGDADNQLSNLVQQLLLAPESPSPTYWQWSHYYLELAKQLDAIRGKSQVQHELLKEKFLHVWNSSFLARYNLDVLGSKDSWLTSVFRKHRKSFSYLQHILIWAALQPDKDASQILEDVRQQPKQPIHPANSSKKAGVPAEVELKRTKWLAVLDQHGTAGVNVARMEHQALYTWLYRHDKDWLRQANAGCRLKRGNNSQTDWSRRDRSVVKKLITIDRSLWSQESGPRRSKNWYLNKLRIKATVEKHLGKMPLCSAFFDRYSETIEEYQIRRICHFVIVSSLRGDNYQRWHIERHCGLDRKRLPTMTESFLGWIELRGHEETTF